MNLTLIYLEFQMSCSKILKSETLPVKSFSISKLELLSFSFFHFILLLVFLKLLLLVPSHPLLPQAHLCLSIEIISF